MFRLSILSLDFFTVRTLTISLCAMVFIQLKKIEFILPLFGGKSRRHRSVGQIKPLGRSPVSVMLIPQPSSLNLCNEQDGVNQLVAYISNFKVPGALSLLCSCSHGARALFLACYRARRQCSTSRD